MKSVPGFWKPEDDILLNLKDLVKNSLEWKKLIQDINDNIMLLWEGYKSCFPDPNEVRFRAPVSTLPPPSPSFTAALLSTPTAAAATPTLPSISAAAQPLTPAAAPPITLAVVAPSSTPAAAAPSSTPTAVVPPSTLAPPPPPPPPPSTLAPPLPPSMPPQPLTQPPHSSPTRPLQSDAGHMTKKTKTEILDRRTPFSNFNPFDFLNDDLGFDEGDINMFDDEVTILILFLKKTTTIYLMRPA